MKAPRPSLMPPGFRIERTEVEGPVFADARGMRSYWPLRTCATESPETRPTRVGRTDEKTTKTGGPHEPYPPGLRNCPNSTKAPRPVPRRGRPGLRLTMRKQSGRFTVITRKDGRAAVGLRRACASRTSHCATRRRRVQNAASCATTREMAQPPKCLLTVKIAAPPPAVPPGFAINTVAPLAGILLTGRYFSIYTSDRGGANEVQLLMPRASRLGSRSSRRSPPYRKVSGVCSSARPVCASGLSARNRSTPTSSTRRPAAFPGQGDVADKACGVHAGRARARRKSSPGRTRGYRDRARRRQGCETHLHI